MTQPGVAPEGSTARPGPPRGFRALPFPLAAARIPLLTLATLVAGGALYLSATTRPFVPNILLGALVLLGAPVVLRTVRGLFRGEFAADVVAMLAIVTAVVLREPIAGLVIVLMQTGGELLERYAEGRASDAVRELEAAAPRVAHRYPPDDPDPLHHATVDVPADRVEIGDRVLVRPGEMVPCDGTVTAGTSSLDTSRLTGEPLPERVAVGSTVRSGVVNLQGPLVITVTAPARDSLYAQIVVRCGPRRRRSRRSSASPTSGPSGSRRSRWRRAPWPGGSPATRAACSPCWSSRRPARCCSRHRWL